MSGSAVTRLHSARRIGGMLIPILCTVACGGDNSPITPEEPPPAAWTWVNPAPTGNPLYDVAVIDDRIVTAVGALGTIVRTDDGGDTWITQDAGTRADLACVEFLDAEHGFVAGTAGLVLETMDGGESWISRAVPTRVDLRDIGFVTGLLGFAVGDSGTILTTVDGGSTWSVTRDSSGATFNEIRFSEPTRG